MARRRVRPKKRIREKKRAPNIFAPLFWSIFGIVLTVIGLAILKIVNNNLKSAILSDSVAYVTNWLPLLLAISLLSGYGMFFWKFRKSVAIFSPILSSVAGIIIIQFGFGLLSLLNNYFQIEFLDIISELILGNIFLFFILFIIFGYLSYVVRLFKSIFGKS